MRTDQWIALFVVLCGTFMTVHLVSAGGGHGHGHGHSGHGGRRNRTECYQAQQLLNQWWSQTQLPSAFHIVCHRLGAAQAWNVLQGLLGVPATGAPDQATFQALFNNGNHASLAQQLFALGGGATTVESTFVGK